ncbi:MAG: hypothetical protein ACAI38_24045 [Myxococcota bacterium]
MPIGPSASAPPPPPFLADYRAGRVLAETGKTLPEGASPATRVGWHIRHDPMGSVPSLEKALNELPDHQRQKLACACQATIYKRVAVPADSIGKMAHAALVSALVAITRG